MNVNQIDKMRALQDRLINRSCTEGNLKTSLLLMEAAEAIGNPLASRHEWINVKDRPPEKFTDVLCLYPSKNYGSNIVIDYMESDRGYFAEQFRYGEPTHWMPLPTPPAEKEN